LLARFFCFCEIESRKSSLKRDMAVFTCCQVSQTVAGWELRLADHNFKSALSWRTDRKLVYRFKRLLSAG